MLEWPLLEDLLFASPGVSIDLGPEKQEWMHSRKPVSWRKKQASTPGSRGTGSIAIVLGRVCVSTCYLPVTDAPVAA